MLSHFVNKQRRAASVVKTALISAGISGRSVCVQSDSWLDNYGRRETYAVFVSAPLGSNIEPYFETGEKLVEVVRSMLDSIKGGKTKNGTAPANQSETAPF